MLVLILFAFVAGAGTAISPCVLPVLPAVLSAGASGGRRRPLAIVLGLAATFTVTIVGFAKVIDGVGLGDGALRSLAVVVLAGFGLALLAPALTARLEAPLSRLARFGPRSTGDGFWSGLGVGAALGFVYAPCAGPILAAVISVSAASGATVAVALAYATGSALVLLALSLGGRRVLGRIRAAGRGPALQRVLGVVMLLTAIAVATDADVRFQTALADSFPSFLVNPTGSLERSDTVAKRLADLRGKPRFQGDSSQPVSASAKLPDLGAAPDFQGNQRWFNTPGDKPLHLAGLRGRGRPGRLLDLHVHQLPAHVPVPARLGRALPRPRADDRRRPHARVPVRARRRQRRRTRWPPTSSPTRSPRTTTTRPGTPTATSTGPPSYLIDARGHVRYAHFGEGDDDKTEAAIRGLLTEAGSKQAGRAHRGAPARGPGRQASPETYLGTARAQGWLPTAPVAGEHDYGPVAGAALPLSRFSLGGRWRVSAEAAEAVRDGAIGAHVIGKAVYLVMSSRDSRPRPVQVLLDGKPIPDAQAGSDVHGGQVVVSRQRLYRLVSEPKARPPGSGPPLRARGGGSRASV